MKLLVLATHPGEELRHIGGSLAKWATKGSDIHVAYLTIGDGMLEEVERLQEMAKAKRALKALHMNPEHIYVLEKQVESVTPHSLSQAIRTLCDELKPERLILPPASSRIHHTRELMQAAEMALDPVCEIPSVLSMNGSQWHVDISEHVLDKQDALIALNGEAHEYPHPFSPEAVEVTAQASGSRVNLLASEAFDVWQVIEG